MKQLIGPAAYLVLCLVLASCNSQTGAKDAGTNSNSVVRNTDPNAIVRGTLISKSGDTLEYRYDNQVHTMDVRFKNISSMLRQDTVASGIRYSNEDFEYTEWHGISRLKQKGNTVFETQSPAN